MGVVRTEADIVVISGMGPGVVPAITPMTGTGGIGSPLASSPPGLFPPGVFTWLTAGTLVSDSVVIGALFIDDAPQGGGGGGAHQYAVTFGSGAPAGPSDWPGPVHRPGGVLPGGSRPRPQCDPADLRCGDAARRSAPDQGREGSVRALARERRHLDRPGGAGPSPSGASTPCRPRPSRCPSGPRGRPSARAWTASEVTARRAVSLSEEPGSYPFFTGYIHLVSY